MSRLILDAGALIALDRNDREMWRRYDRASRERRSMITHAGIVGQVWRRPARQARLASALAGVLIEPLSPELAKAAGLLLEATRTADVHDAAVALLCREEDVLLTSDVDDLTALLSARGCREVELIRV